MTHTEGPWTVDDDTLDILAVTIGDAPAYIACQPAYQSGRPLAEEEITANLRLLCAAPELLAVAKMAFDYAQDTKARFAEYFDGDDAESYDNLCDACDAAIAKAEGRE